jgi:hypothetical protein
MFGKKLLFCKKICDINNRVKNVDFDYRSFGHFDGFFVKDVDNVDDYSDFRKDNASFGSHHIERIRSENLFIHNEKQVINCLYVPLGDGEILPNENYQILDPIPENSAYPIVSVSIVNDYECSCDTDAKINDIKLFFSTRITELSINCTFEIFKTLSIEDYVVVLRSKTLHDITWCLEELRKNEQFNAINLYSIVSIDNRTTDSYRASRCDNEDDLYASMRLYVCPTASFVKLVERIQELIPDNNSVKILKENESGAADHTDVFTSYGRYDIQMLLTTKNLSDLLELFNFVNNGIAAQVDSAEDESAADILFAIISTETTLLSDLEAENNRIFHKPIDTQDVGFAEIINRFRTNQKSKMIAQIEKDETYDRNELEQFHTEHRKLNDDFSFNYEHLRAIKKSYVTAEIENNYTNFAKMYQYVYRYPPLMSYINQVDEMWGVKFSEPIYLLIERVHQLKHATFSHKYANSLSTFTNSFVEDVVDLYTHRRISFTLDDLNKTVRKIINNIDNLFSVSFRDFELAQKDGMQVHASGKVLVAYRNFVHNEVRAAKSVSLSETAEIDILTTVIAEIQSSISIDTIPGAISKVKNNELKINRIYNMVTIPPALIYNLTTALFALSHEAGHGMLIGQKKRDKLLDDIFNEDEQKRLYSNLHSGTNIPMRSNDSILLMKELLLNLFKEFFADAFAANSLGFTESQKLIEKDFYYYFINIISPSSELEGIHIVLRKIAFCHIILGMGKNDIGDYLDYTQDYSFTRAIPLNILDIALRKLRDFYKDTLKNCYSQINSNAPVYHTDFKSHFVECLDVDRETREANKREVFQQFISCFIDPT